MPSLEPTIPSPFLAVPPNEEMSNEELIAAMVRVESWALSQFYDRHAGLLYAMAYRVLNQPQEAEDAVQEAFLQIWHKAHSYNPKLGSALTWAITLTRNKSIDKLRSRQRRQAVLIEEVEGAPPTVDVNAVQAGEIVQEKEAAAVVRQALAQLPLEQRQPIELAFFRGLSQTEIAQALSEPLGTIKARIRRGMMKLREPLLQLRLQ